MINSKLTRRHSSNSMETNQQNHVFCHQCGKPISAEMVFCPSCGTKLNIAADSQAQNPEKIAESRQRERNWRKHISSTKSDKIADTADDKKSQKNSIFDQTDSLPTDNNAAIDVISKQTEPIFEVTSNLQNQDQPIVTKQNQQLNYNLSNKYFTPTIGSLTLFGCFMPLLGLILFAVFLQFTSSNTPASLALFLAVVITVIIAAYDKTPSDQEYDNNTLAAISNIKNAALTELDLDSSEVEDVDPIIIKYYSYNNASKIKRGNDGIIRTNMYEVIVFFFSAIAIHICKYVYSTTDNTKFTLTDEYFYKDIVAISTKMGNQAVILTDKTNININYQYCEIITTGGTTLQITMPDQESLNSIKAMRNLLKEKKNS